MNMASQSHVPLTHVCWGSSQSHMMTSPYSENLSLWGTDSVKQFLSWSHKELRRAWKGSDIIMLRQVSPLWLFWVGGQERTTRIFIYVCIKRPRLSFLLNMVKCSWNSFLRDLKMLCSSSTLLHTVNVSFTFLLVVSIMSNWWFCSCTCTKDQMFPPVCLQEERKPESWFQWSRWKDVYWALKQRRVETELFSLRCFSSRYIWFVTEEMIHVFDS